MIIFKSVDFPLPLGPVRPNLCPGGKAIFTPSNSVFPPKLIVISSNVTAITVPHPSNLPIAAGYFYSQR
jgi:hypothetical protein